LARLHRGCAASSNVATFSRFITEIGIALTGSLRRQARAGRGSGSVLGGARAVGRGAVTGGPGARIELGKALFFDPRLSGNGTVSCVSCHNPALGWSGGLPTGVGITTASRSRPTSSP